MSLVKPQISPGAFLYSWVRASTWSMTQCFPLDNERERLRTNEEICNQSYRFSTRRHFRRVNWRCRLVSVTPAVRADTRPQPGEIIANPHPAPPACLTCPRPGRKVLISDSSSGAAPWSVMSGIISWLSFPLPFPPVVTMEGRGGLKGFQRVCVCVRAHVHAFVFTFPLTPLTHPLIFCDAIASVWVCAVSGPTEGCESVCRSFSCILREENTKKKHSRLSCCVMTHFLFQDCLCI